MSNYIGRFAPSPTGPLHMGSLVAAVGSYLYARINDGIWYVRMEDLDPPREQQGASDLILSTLRNHGLTWDGDVLYQSRYHSDYQAAADFLLKQNNAYYCSCSRKTLSENARRGEFGLIYPGSCRDRRNIDPDMAIRVKTHDQRICYSDPEKGHFCQKLESELGDFVIKRADGYFAYQLAVVVDDEKQGITEVVRGEDLLDNTPRQIYLQTLLGYQTPNYRHLPLVTNELGQKLSKQTHAQALDNSRAAENLTEALGFLGLSTTGLKKHSTPEDILNIALSHLAK